MVPIAKEDPIITILYLPGALGPQAVFDRYPQPSNLYSINSLSWAFSQQTEFGIPRTPTVESSSIKQRFKVRNSLNTRLEINSVEPARIPIVARLSKGKRIQSLRGSFASIPLSGALTFD
jgi:hypothetical protein